MPSTLFDSAGLAIVAYAQVDGATGSSSSSALANSGVSSTKLSTGVYQVDLSTALTQALPRDLIFVQPKQTTALPTPADRFADVFELNAQSKLVKVYAGGGTTAMDSDFNILVLRTVLP